MLSTQVKFGGLPSKRCIDCCSRGPETLRVSTACYHGPLAETPNAKRSAEELRMELRASMQLKPPTKTNKLRCIGFVQDQSTARGLRISQMGRETGVVAPGR